MLNSAQCLGNEHGFVIMIPKSEVKKMLYWFAKKEGRKVQTIQRQVSAQVYKNRKNTRVARNWTTTCLEGILENPHASMTSFEAIKQALKSILLCPLLISTIPPI